MRIAVALLLFAAATVPVSGLPAEDCVPSCTILASDGAYLPPVTVVASGGAVVWETLDVGHTNVDGVLPAIDYCFVATASPGLPSPPVTFEIAAGALYADGTECTSAVTAGAGFALGFWCVQHPQMRGSLVVVA